VETPDDRREHRSTLNHSTALKGRFDMKPTRMHPVWIAALLSTVAIAGPVSTAGAATAAAATGPVAEQAATVTGQRFVSTSPSTFINYNSQTSVGTISSGNQYAA
jgi:hypothetical protein